MTIIAICNNKGGPGKTKTTQHLACALAQLGVNRVAVMDLDGQANLTDAMLGVARGSRPATSMADVLSQKATLGDAIQWAIDPPVWVFPADDTLDDVADDLVTIPLGVLRLKTAIERERGRFDMLLIDCPPNVGALTYSALIAADYVLVPTAPAQWSINGVRRIQQKVAEVKSALGYGPALLGMVATQRRNTIEHDNGMAALNTPEMPRLLGEIPHRGGIDADSALAEAYLPVAQNVLRLIGGDHEQTA